MKTVVSPEMVAHLWAHQSQDYARNARGNIYFSGATIYSYGNHFQIATHVTGTRGRKGILFTTRGYSNTTSRHISDVRYAIRGTDNVFNIPLPDISNWVWSNKQAKTRTCTDLWKTYLERIGNSLLAAGKARKYADQHRSNALWLADQANAFSEFFGLRRKLPADLQTIADSLEKERARLARAEAKRHKELAKRNEQDRKERATKYAEALSRWIAGESVRLPYAENGEANHLRIVGETIESDRGAEIPVEHAKKAFPLIRRCRENNTTFSPNGHTIHLGHFAIDRIDPDGTVKAGCHTVKWEEIERMARELELI